MEVSEDNNIIHSMSLACKQVLWSRKGRVQGNKSDRSCTCMHVIHVQGGHVERK